MSTSAKAIEPPKQYTLFATRDCLGDNFVRMTELYASLKGLRKKLMGPEPEDCAEDTGCNVLPAGLFNELDTYAQWQSRVLAELEAEVKGLHSLI